MSESSYHTKMVEEVSLWIKNYNPSTTDLMIFSDLPNTPRHKLPEIFNNFRPDVYARNLTSRNVFIGEAKTGPDLETPHSVRQIRSFLKYLSNEENSIFIIATSWEMIRCAKVLVSALQKEVCAEKVQLQFLTVWP